MHSTTQRFSFRALFRALQYARLNTWTRRVAALLVVLLVAFVGGLAMAQDAPPPGPPGTQAPPSPPGTPEAPGQPAAPGQPGTAPAFEQTIKGDTGAWAEVEAALKKLGSLSGYREKSSAVGIFGERSVTTSEVIPPNSTHTTSESTSYSFNGTEFPAVASESVGVKGQTLLRTKSGDEPWGPWKCFKARPPVDMRGVSIQGTIEASRGPDTVIEGTPVRTYVYTIVSTLTSPDTEPRIATGKTTLYVDTQTGLPRRSIDVVTVHVGSDDKELTTTKDFYDYDAKIEITLPPCEEEI